ncbi:replication protein A 14 kDa subunit [Setaria viridis]|uniref:replication protein A 14 kDa subunit n=1 Tax=Setaria viridis TaxID=4556 RepID=UPI003B3BC50B
MDPSELPAFANGEILKTMVGRRVRTVVQVQRNNGGVVVGQSTDGHQLTIRGAMDVPVSHFMEVFGTAESDQSICAEVCTDFGNNFGEIWTPIVLMFGSLINASVNNAESFNGLCNFANKVKELFQ